jgi:hypothetical protein
MPKFRVIASYLTFCELELEADNEDEAWELAREADGGDFEPLKGRWQELNDWHLDSINEVKE